MVLTNPITGQPMTVTTPGSGEIPDLESMTPPAGSSIDPLLYPYLSEGLEELRRLTFGQSPTLYPGQTYVPPSEATTSALNFLEAYGGAPSTALTAGRDAYLEGLSGIQKTAQGSFLTGSPFLQSQIDSATRPVMQQFERSTLPAIQSAFSKAGRYGSGAQAQAIGFAQEGLSRAVGDISSTLTAADFSRERGFMESALRDLISGGEAAPSIYEAGLLPAETLAKVGGARESISSQALKEAMARYDFEQRTPMDQLTAFLSGVYGTPLASSTSPPPPRSETNTVAEIIGAGTGIYASLPESTKKQVLDYLFGS